MQIPNPTSQKANGTAVANRNTFAQKEIKKEFNANKIEHEFRDVQSTFYKCTGSVLCVGALGILIGSIKWGSGFASKALRVTGDAFGAVAALLVPFALAKNEINDYNLLKHGKEKGSGAQKHSINELIYRCVSIGFMPYSFESLIDPEKIGKSGIQKLAAIINIPNLAFTSFTLGIGNINSIIAWILRTKQQLNFDKEETEWNKLKENGFQGLSEAEISKKFTELEGVSKRKQCFNQLYSSTKRFATIGGIALPAMHGLRRFAETCDFIFKEGGTFKEFISNPFTALSRTINLAIGLPEVFAKGFDSVARIVQEKDHLKPALPKFLINPLDKFSRYFDSCVSSESNNPLKSVRNLAEVLFHTLSPASQLAFLSPILDQKATNEEAQSKGGIVSILDKVIGRSGKSVLYLTSLPYMFVSRLPQSLVQSIYFGRYYYGKHIKKESDKETKNAIENIQNKICNFPIIKQVSKKVESIINYLVPDYIENEFPDFIDIQVKTSFAQAEEVFKNKLQEGNALTESENKEILDYSLDYVKRSANRGYAKLNDQELLTITQKLQTKIDCTLDPKKQTPRRTNIKFPGAYLLSHFLRPFNISKRIKSLSTETPFHRMETAYNIDEIPAFETQEFLIMLSECFTSGLRNTANLTFGVPTESEVT